MFANIRFFIKQLQLAINLLIIFEIVFQILLYLISYTTILKPLE